jgi:outer membrane protein assembly factor BamB
VGAIAVLGVVAVIAIAAVGPDDQRLAHDRKLDTRAPGPVQTAAATARASHDPPPEVIRAAREWPLPNRDYANTRATRDAVITAANVGQLGLAWTLPLHGASKWGTAASGPLIADGRILFQDLRSNVTAIDVASGAVRWQHLFDQAAFGPNGPAIGWGKVFAQDGDRHLAALDAHTGRLVWGAVLGGPTGQQQPTAYGGRVLTGIAAGRRARGTGDLLKTYLLGGGSSGFAYGVDAASGAVNWDFQTVEPGFWGDPKVNAGGGIWGTPAIDAASGVAYWSTGNPAPGPGTKDHPNASSRPGPNLYSNTLLAIDTASGKVRWFNQLLPHDLLHHDLQNPPILIDAGGRQLVIASGKMGVVYAVDRATGRLVWKRPVGRHQNDTRTSFPIDRGVIVYPGFWGGLETPGAAADGVLYYQVDDLPTPYTGDAWASKDGAAGVDNLEGRTRYADGTSSMVAIDAATGRVRWTTPLPTVGFGGATVVNDLVFTATYDGTLYALRRADGAIVWRFRAPAGINAWPAVTGDTIVWPAGLGRKPVLLALRLRAPGAATPPPEAVAP